MEFARGQLYRHRLRPQWGWGLFVGIIDGKPQLYFDDGQLRGFSPSARDLFLEAEPAAVQPGPQATMPSKKRRRQAAKLARPSPAPRVWTPERDTELRRLDALKLTEAEIGERMGLSKPSIACRRGVLGLGRRVAWSGEDDARLRELAVSKTPNVSIAAEMSRTLAAVRARRRHLGLGVDLLPRWTASEDALVRNTSPEEVVAWTGRSKVSVFNRRAKLGATTRTCKRWSGSDDALVLAGGVLEDIARELGRTVGSIRHRAGRLRAAKRSMQS